MDIQDLTVCRAPLASLANLEVRDCQEHLDCLDQLESLDILEYLEKLDLEELTESVVMMEILGCLGLTV